MYALVVAALIAGAPAPTPKPFVDFKPGTYQGKWAGAEWGPVLFHKSGYYSWKYRNSSFFGASEFHYQGIWHWCPITRILIISETSGEYVVGCALTTYQIEFPRTLDKGLVIGSAVEMLLRK